MMHEPMREKRGRGFGSLGFWAKDSMNWILAFWPPQPVLWKCGGVANSAAATAPCQRGATKQEYFIFRDHSGAELSVFIYLCQRSVALAEIARAFLCG